MNHAVIIERLGGPALVASALGRHRTRVLRWRVVGIPPARFLDVVKLARRYGLQDITLDALYAGRALIQRRAARAARVAA
jgi:hypothetical protein